MDKIGRILTLFFRLYNGQRINKFSFSLEMEIDARTFERDIRDIRLFLAENFSFHEIQFDRADNVYYMTGRERRELTDVEFTAAATILIGSKALGKGEITGLVNQLYQMTYNKKSIPWQMFKEDLAGYGQDIHGKPVLKMHWDLAQCIIREKAIKLQYEGEGQKVSIAVMPERLFYENSALWLETLDLEQGVHKQLLVERIESFEIIRYRLPDSQP